MPSLLANLRSEQPKKNDSDVLTFQREGYLVFVGRNAFSNERLVAEHPHKGCLWMHATASRGSHVVLCIEGHPEPSPAVLQYAAEVALKNSHSEARTVSVALLKDIFKPEDGGVGVWKSNRVETLEVL